MGRIDDAITDAELEKSIDAVLFYQSSSACIIGSKVGVDLRKSKIIQKELTRIGVLEKMEDGYLRVCNTTSELKLRYSNVLSDERVLRLYNMILDAEQLNSQKASDLISTRVMYDGNSSPASRLIRGNSGFAKGVLWDHVGVTASIEFDNGSTCDVESQYLVPEGAELPKRRAQMTDTDHYYEAVRTKVKEYLGYQKSEFSRSYLERWFYNTKQTPEDLARLLGLWGGRREYEYGSC